MKIQLKKSKKLRKYSTTPIANQNDEEVIICIGHKKEADVLAVEIIKRYNNHDILKDLILSNEKILNSMLVTNPSLKVIIESELKYIQKILNEIN
jgi:hypothetical protein